MHEVCEKRGLGGLRKALREILGSLGTGHRWNHRSLPPGVEVGTRHDVKGRKGVDPRGLVNKPRVVDRRAFLSVYIHIYTW